MQIDDSFYYTQRVACVLLWIIAAVEYNFSEIINVKSASSLIDSTVEILD